MITGEMQKSWRPRMNWNASMTKSSLSVPASKGPENVPIALPEVSSPFLAQRQEPIFHGWFGRNYNCLYSPRIRISPSQYRFGAGIGAAKAILRAPIHFSQGISANQGLHFGQASTMLKTRHRGSPTRWVLKW